MSGGSFRLAELLGGLTLTADIANGFHPEKAIRTALLAARLAELHGESPETRRDVLYGSLLRFMGCTAFAHEEGALYGAGDDRATRTTMALADIGDPIGTLKRILRGIAPEAPLPGRVRAVARLLGDGSQAVLGHAHAQCEASIRLASILGFSGDVMTALAQICERWDGRGEPHRVRGEALIPVVRFVHFADVLELVLTNGGDEAAQDVARARAGKHFEPGLCETFVRHSREFAALLDAPSVWEAYLAAEPDSVVLADESRLDDVALAFAYFADLKSVYTLGHSTGVASLVERAANARGMTETAVRSARRAALLHDLGRVSVPNGIWDKPGKLSPPEWERVRLHAYYTERILWQAPVLRPIAQVASAAHERLDGAGYPRAVPRGMIDAPARLLAAADVYHALLEPRPHRPALDREGAKRTLLQEAERGRLDLDAVHAVLEAAGERTDRPLPPKGLSEREVEVLRLVARGRSNKEIAVALGISPKTVQHHVAHVYDKIGVESRAAAALFAVENGLLAS